MILAHGIRLVPRADQESYFVRARGVARFAYNWALAEWQRQYRRIADIRVEALHQLTTSLTRYRTIVIEDLNVAGMLANRSLSRAISTCCAKNEFLRSQSEVGRADRAARPTTAMSTRRAISHDTRRVHPRQPVEPNALAAR